MLPAVPFQSLQFGSSNEAPTTIGRGDRSQRSIRFCGPARLLAKPDPVEESPQRQQPLMEHPDQVGARDLGLFHTALGESIGGHGASV